MPNFTVDENNLKHYTATRCNPFTDSFTTGYTQELYCDVEVTYRGKNPETNEDIIAYTWAGPHRPIDTRMERFGDPNLFPKFEGFYKAEFHWFTQWEPKTPPGYSTMYHHPSNRFDLPFHTFTGIIDTDKWPIGGPLPFILKEGFEGVIPAGTPIYQMTFIKRDSWESSEAEFKSKEVGRILHQAKKYFKGGYKREFWEKKHYN